MSMQAESTDEHLIAAALDGREEAFDELMQRHQRFVYRLAYGFGRSHENALDLSQIIFLKVYRKLALFGGRASFRTWLAKVAYHEGVNWQKAQRRHLEGHEELLEVADRKVRGQDETLLAKERGQVVLGALIHLNRRHRTAVELRYFHDMTLREIASVLGCTEAVAKNAVFRGVRTLRSRLGET